MSLRSALISGEHISVRRAFRHWAKFSNGRHSRRRASHHWFPPRSATSCARWMTRTSRRSGSVFLDGSMPVLDASCRAATSISRVSRSHSVLYDSFQRPLFVDNDGNMALVGEHAVGRARNVANAIMFTIGTGIGGAAIMDGACYAAAQQRASSVTSRSILTGSNVCVAGVAALRRRVRARR